MSCPICRGSGFDKDDMPCPCKTSLAQNPLFVENFNRRRAEQPQEAKDNHWAFQQAVSDTIFGYDDEDPKIRKQVFEQNIKNEIAKERRVNIEAFLTLVVICAMSAIIGGLIAIATCIAIPVVLAYLAYSIIVHVFGRGRG